MLFARTIALGLVCGAALVGCGSDEETKEPEPAQGTVNEAVAQSTAQSVISAVNLAIVSNDGPGAAFALAGAGASAFAIITPATAGAPQSASVGTARQADSTGTCDCNGSTCTFTDCGSDGTSGGGTWLVNGTMSWDAGHMMCDLTITGDFQGFTYSLHETCDLTTTDTSIDGSVKTQGAYDIATGQPGYGNVSASWDSSITFNAVEYGASGCPASGSIDIAASFTTSGASYEGAGSVTFDGSGC